MNINQLDLNLLIILKQLLEEKHVSNTALTLGISQPSISRSLAKLRAIFDDPLLIRMSGGYELTPKAESIYHDLNSILSNVERLVNKQDFDPLTNEATIKVFGLPPQMNLLVQAIIGAFRHEAPNMTLDIDTSPKPQFADLLKGDVHFVVTGHQPSVAEDKLYRIPLFKREFVLLMAKTHQLANGPLTIARLSQCHFGKISVQGEKSLSIAHCFEALGFDNISTPIRLKNFDNIGTITENSDVIFYVPNHFADELCQHYSLISRPAPNELKINQSQVCLYWHQRYHNDPVCKWFRSLISEQLFNN
ncbi:LysR family transcriptional regulator [Shewanella algicola]|uniref:LysR family transcriptional regulator n=1 Tax=Shewanella algicola TaxID=640633 RepID=A0A9X1Z593_9GAMM|nr:LysR family transcriptional regulator [Shewanella algicola]MCL1106441.1 LysR family transcriptional regulator [Shewanella algicola]GGP59447.1 LysR family transcriptional regulator [Shewanella algicola]